MNFSKDVTDRLEHFQELQLANEAIRAGNEEKLKEDEEELSRIKKEVVNLAKSGKTADIVKMKHQIDDLQFEIDTLMAAIRTAPDVSAEYTADDLRELWDDMLDEVTPDFREKRSKLEALKKESAELYLDMINDVDQLHDYRVKVKELMPDFPVWGFRKDYGMSRLPKVKWFNDEFSSDNMLGAKNNYAANVLNSLIFG